LSRFRNQAAWFKSTPRNQIYLSFRSLPRNPATIRIDKSFANNRAALRLDDIEAGERYLYLLQGLGKISIDRYDRRERGWQVGHFDPSLVYYML
jgi:hypothetical protein